jgi:TPR repeat protein
MDPVTEAGRQLERFSRWFHEHGIAWSGTPAELASELSNIGQAEGLTHSFKDPDKLYSWLEDSAKALQEYGVEAFVRQRSGAPRSITLRSMDRGPQDQLSAAERHHESELRKEGGPPASEESESGRTIFGEKLLRKQRSKVSKESQPQPPVAAPVAEDDRSVQKFTFKTTERPKSRPVPVWLIILGWILVFALLTLVLRHYRRTTTLTTAADRNSSVQASPARDVASETSKGHGFPIASGAEALKSGLGENKKTIHGGDTQQQASTLTKDLIREATDKRLPASQYELGNRYAEGRGIATDKVAAYVWIVLARFNGDQRGAEQLKALAKQLSPSELQRVRLALGDSFARGKGVTRNDVLAHSWYSLAVLAGSAEARTRKHEIESKMTPEQIHDAETRTTAWLSRH